MKTGNHPIEGRIDLMSDCGVTSRRLPRRVIDQRTARRVRLERFRAHGLQINQTSLRNLSALDPHRYGLWRPDAADGGHLRRATEGIDYLFNWHWFHGSPPL